jgi:hypothetical protein
MIRYRGGERLHNWIQELFILLGEQKALSILDMVGLSCLLDQVYFFNQLDFFDF